MPLKIDTTRLRQLDRVIPRCQIIDIPSGDPPKNVTVELPVGDGARVLARWYGWPNIATDDYVRIQRRGNDNRYDIVGSDAGTAMGESGWPFAILNANTGLKYTSLPTAESEASNNDLLLLGPGTHDLGASTLSITKNLRITGPGWDICTITSSANPTINVNGPTVYIEDVEIESTSTDATVSAFEATSEVHLDRVAARTTGGTVENRGFWLNVSLGDTMYLHDCLAFTNDDVDILNSGNTIYISGFRSRLRGITAGGGNTFLVWPLIRNAGTGLSGTSINGWFVDSSSSDDAYQVASGTVLGPLGIGGFPADDIVMIDTVPYSTITAAIAAASSGDAIKAGFGAFNENLTFDFSGRLVGLGPERCRIYSSAADDVLEVTANNGSFEGLDFLQSTTTDAKACIYINAVDNTMVRDCILLHNGAATNAYGVRVTGDGHEFQRCEITANGATNNWAVYSDADSSEITLRECILAGDVEVTGSATTLDVFGGYIDGDIVVTADSPTITLHGLPTITGAVPSTASGLYRDGNGDVRSAGGANLPAIVVTNSSGGTVSAGDIGYLDEAGEFQTTTTAQDEAVVGNGAVVIKGGNDAAEITVVTSGTKITVNYTGSAPSAGDFLVTSTTAGEAQVQTTMRPEIFAVCTAGGSGGTVEATLLINRAYIPKTSTNNQLAQSGIDTKNTTWTGTINDAAPTSSPVTVSTSTSNINTITPDSSSDEFKIVLRNTTQGNEALIDSISGNDVTFVDDTPLASWTNGDSLTAQTDQFSSATRAAQTLDMSQSLVPVNATAVLLYGLFKNTATAGAFHGVHPYDSWASAQLIAQEMQNTSRFIRSPVTVPVFEQRIIHATGGGSAGSFNCFFKLLGYWIPSP